MPLLNGVVVQGHDGTHQRNCLGACISLFPWLGVVPQSTYRQDPKDRAYGGRLADKDTALYILYNTEGRCLYVGVTTNPNTRFSEHREDKVWWTQVDLNKTQITWYQGRRARQRAEEAEVKMISELRPLFNVKDTEEGEATG